MEKKPNFLQFLADEQADKKFDAVELGATITVALAVDENLYNFIKDTVVTKYIVLGKELPKDAKAFAEEMANVVASIVTNLTAAIGAYDMYLKIGKIALLVGMMHALDKAQSTKAE